MTGFVCDASEGKIGFAPRLTPEDFKAFFTAAEAPGFAGGYLLECGDHYSRAMASWGWGSLVQKRAAGRQTNRIEVKWGKLDLKELRLELPSGAKLQDATVTVANRRIAVATKQADRCLTIVLDEPLEIAQDQAVEVGMTFLGGS